jgi:8-hydroxy-5-deazaflavin:NADPH oxidoreductase
MTLPAVAVLGGTGQQGRGLALRLARAGHPVIVGSRDPRRAAAIVSEWPPTTGHLSAHDFGGATAAAKIVVLAVPFEAIDPLLAGLRPSFQSGTLVVDVTVPITFGANGPALADVAEGSATEYVRARLPETVRLAGAFKTIPAHLLNEAERPVDCDEFICGDSAEARAAASALASAIEGLRPVDVGPLSRARSIEHLTLLAIAINRRHKVRDARFRVAGL